ncbi:uncharacterized protein LOC111283602 [Durio zibethinus]|uniref:Uncharacterized protein LOC111283602 n=1 Tax=Durio zibethinus TaxID=66656 RepID=A0A6P5XHR2_DURZI|nr:uncharacterized protein LOC111283602 [Durio zibethinus]
MDVIGPIRPKASNGHRFILVVINYFTKWVKIASYANVTRMVVCKFIKKEIICQYSFPKRIISDNALNLNNKMMTEDYFGHWCTVVTGRKLSSKATDIGARFFKERSSGEAQGMADALAKAGYSG